MNRKIIIQLFFLLHIAFVQAQEKVLSFISNSHLDTQWNWDVKTTIDQYILNTMTQNFPLFDKYPGFQFNFESAIHYMWMKEYYPTQYARLKEYIQNGRWHISGGAINACDVMVPSAESIIRNFLYGQTYYKKEFGMKGGNDIMLPDCFGFPYSLPTLGKHCGATGFHSTKLAWGSAYDYNSLPPFGIWKGVDGSEIYAILKPEAYDDHEKYNKDMSKDQDILNVINSNYSKYGIYAAFRYVGPRSDRGGGLQDDPASSTNNTPFWLQISMDSNGPVSVKMETPTQIFKRLDQHRNSKYFVWDNELPMSTHGTGCYTSQTIMKYWNRKNELLADATEKSAVISDWLGGLKYPADMLRESWIRLLWHQFHDDLTGTSIPNAYFFSYNDEALVNMNLSKTLLNSVGAVAKQMDTRVNGIPLVVYNPLSINRTDIVESFVITNSKPTGIRVLDSANNDVLAQVLDYDSTTGKLTFIFQATVPSLGYAVYELRLNESKGFTSSLSITQNLLENESYQVTINNKGDVSSIYDKKNNKELLQSPLRLAMVNNRSDAWPAWEITWNTITALATYVEENVSISIVENGPLRVSLKVSRSKSGSDFIQYIRLTPSNISDRIDFVNEVNWKTRGILLKAIFPLRAANSTTTYDLSIGAIGRGINTSKMYEVPSHQWVDQMHTDGTYGISILNDCKYGWDKPNSSTLRLSLIHTPAVGSNYIHHKNQDLGFNKFTYSFYRHDGEWNEATQWEASRLNQPLLAFQSPKHDGTLGKSCGFVSVNTNKVAIKALKKAEESDEIIVRVYELTGKNQTGVKITFPANIIAANEVNGIEEKTGEVSLSGNDLSFDIGKFQPKTFAVRLKNPASAVATQNPSSIKVNLNYNVDVMSYDSKKADATLLSVTYAYPAELLSDMITADGIEFTIGNRSNGSSNAVYCNGQTIALPTTPTAKKLYILAASKNTKGSKAEFVVDGVTHTFTIPYYAGNVAVWETEYNLDTEYRRENVAFTATHRHDARNNSNNSYNFMYMYKYCIPVNGNVSNLTLPNDNNIFLFAVSLSDNENDNIIPASEIASLPEKNSDFSGECSMKLIPKSVSASHQNGSAESAEKATDGDINTQWRVINNDAPWLELTFDTKVEICRWFMLNAGLENPNYITAAFRLQKYENGQWIDVDIVENNTLNKVDRLVNAFTTDRIRLQINKAAQNSNVTRILEFVVFGKKGTTGIQTLKKPEEKIAVTHYPNPFAQKTTIRCLAPENVSELNLQVYDLWGKLVDTQTYQLTPQSGIQEIIWDSKQLSDGIYFYSVSAWVNGKLLRSNTGKMIRAKASK